jgi:L-amino acid N-acyltransferase YncA
MRIRLATPDDAASIADIYAPYCINSSITFEIEPVSAEAMAERMIKLGVKYPWLVADDNGTIAGYAYAGPHHERAAYRWSSNVSVYVDQAYQRRGIGRALYRSLFDFMRLQGFANAIAGITLPNPPSVALHESLGFKLVGVYRQIGYKLGVWGDVGWWQLVLQEQPPEPNEPRSPVEVADRISF